MMQRYRTFVVADTNGQITKDVSWYGDSPGPEYTEVADVASRMAIQSEHHKLLLVDGVVVRKPVVTFLATTDRITADGVEEAVVTLADVPESYAEVALTVAGEPVTVDRDEEIVITMSSAGTVVVELNEPLLHADRLTIVGLAAT